jgi:hypothetical protein
MGAKNQSAFNTGIVLCLREPSATITVYRSYIGVFHKEAELSEDDAMNYLKGYTRCIALMRQWPDDVFSGIYIPLSESKHVAQRVQEEFIAFVDQYQSAIIAFQQRGLDG